MDIRQITKEIIAGRRLTREDDISFLLEGELDELADCANEIRTALCGNHIDLCTIINGRSGHCSEDCRFCAQSAHNHTGCETYDVLTAEEVLADARKNEQYRVHRYSIVTAGRSLSGEALDKTLDIYRELHAKVNMKLCASHGLETAEELAQLKASGVDHYHENIETSRRFFPEVCSTHTYEDKIKEIHMAQAAGLKVCCGGIIGMGETWQDRIDMAFEIADLQVDSIPINALMPVPGTPFGNQKRLSEDEIIRTIVIFRFLNPTAYVRMAAGRSYFADGGRRIFQSGANAAITGDMLTTVGNNTKQDIAMFCELGFEL